MITLHGIPVVREGVLIAVTLPFFDLHAHFDAKAAGARPGCSAQGPCGGTEAYRLGLLIDKLATLRFGLLPGFFTADSRH